MNIFRGAQQATLSFDHRLKWVIDNAVTGMEKSAKELTVSLTCGSFLA